MAVTQPTRRRPAGSVHLITLAAAANELTRKSLDDALTALKRRADALRDMARDSWPHPHLAALFAADAAALDADCDAIAALLDATRPARKDR